MSKTNFLHTADLHLAAEKRERLDILRWLLERAKEWKASLIIVGDLFDSDQDANILRAEVRKVFSSFPEVATFITAGNHDEKSFSKEMDYGCNVRLFQSPFMEIEFEGIRLIGVPYQSNSRLTSALNTLQNIPDPSMLLVHGTFFDEKTSFVREEVKKKGEDYFPIHPEDISDKNILYIAMGHFHTNFRIFNLPVRDSTQTGNCNKIICYPGTPLSLSESEIGIRKVAKVVIDNTSKDLEVSEYPVEIGDYKLKKCFKVYPGGEEETLETSAKYLSENISQHADVKIEFKGYIKIDETLMNSMMESLKKRYKDKFCRLNLINDTISYKNLLEKHVNIKEFVNRLKDYNVRDAIKDRALELGLQAFDSELS